MRKFCLVVVISLVSFSNPLGTGFPQQRFLRVQLKPQERSLWCWAASGQMIMAYHGSNVTQCKQVEDQLGVACCGPSPDSGCNVGGWPDFGQYGFTFKTTSNTALSWAQIQGQILARRPVAFSWHYNGCDDDEAGHMMVLSGYKTVTAGNFVKLLNPLPVGKGDTAWEPYDYYLDGGQDFCHWDDYYDVSQ